MFFPGGDAIAQRIKFGARGGYEKNEGEIVGIVGDVHHFGVQVLSMIAICSDGAGNRSVDGDDAEPRAKRPAANPEHVAINAGQGRRGGGGPRSAGRRALDQRKDELSAIAECPPVRGTPVQTIQTPRHSCRAPGSG